MLFQTVTAVLLLSLVPAWCKNLDSILYPACFDYAFPPAVPALDVGQVFRFYSRNGAASVNELQPLPDVFREGLPTAFIVHGFRTDVDVNVWMADMKDALLGRNLDQREMNVVIVGWAKGAAWSISKPRVSYCEAVANTHNIGRYLTDKMRQVLATGTRAADIHCIGHSLGAHVCGRAGRQLTTIDRITIGRITGLDPARPLFQNYPGEGLQQECATFVDVIHTNGDSSCPRNKVYPLGTMVNLGHVDFYPNYGHRQTGCLFRRHGDPGYIEDDEDCPASETRAIRWEPVACSHEKAFKYFTASILRGNCLQVDFRCGDDYTTIPGSCNLTCDAYDCPTSMGYDVEQGSTGLFYLYVGARPYCNNNNIPNF